jgi:hypothetical protein
MDQKAWEELFLTYLCQFGGSVSGVPLSYFVHVHFHANVALYL